MLADMANQNTWHVGVILVDGTHEILTNEGGIDPESIDEIVFPVSRPWSQRADLYRAPFQLVESHERNMGSEDRYRAQVEDRGPDGDQHWEMSLEYVEYMDPIVVDLDHTDNVTYADWSSRDLLDAMSNRF